MEEKTIIVAKETKNGKHIEINGSATQIIDNVYAILESLVRANCGINILEILDVMVEHLKKEHVDEQAN